MNKLTLIGRLTADAELTTVGSQNTPCCRFTIAVDRPWTYGDDKKTDFFNTTIWGKRADAVAKFLTKGKQIAVDGYVFIDVVEKDGGKNWYTKVTAENVELLGSKGDGSKPTEADIPANHRNDAPKDGRDDPNSPNYMQPVSDDQLPF